MAIYKDIGDHGETITDKDAVNMAVRNICLADYGSMPGIPTYGAGLQGMLFEQLDYFTIENLKNNLKQSIETFDERVYVKNVDIQEVPEFNRITISVTYDFEGYSETAKLTLSM